MDYNELYDALIKQVHRATIILQQHYDLQRLVQEDVKKDFLYDVFLIDAIPNGISEILRLITQDEHWLKIDKECGIPFIKHEDSHFIMNLYNSMYENRTQAIATFSAFGSIAGEELLSGIVDDITNDLDRTEKRLELLEAKLKK